MSGLSQTIVSSSLSCANPLGPSSVAPFALDVAQYVDDFRVCSATAFGEADDARATVVWDVGAHDITEAFEAPQQLVHRLFANAGALGEKAGANSVRAGKLQYRDVRQA